MQSASNNQNNIVYHVTVTAGRKQKEHQFQLFWWNDNINLDENKRAAKDSSARANADLNSTFTQGGRANAHTS